MAPVRAFYRAQRPERALARALSEQVAGEYARNGPALPRV
ncbi:hypothetical protein U91I_02614 [alpha proteobacterium U9-1i]|nr:hypothetical protein U91I_02614 [alpha proteobacterium U9-1i]